MATPRKATTKKTTARKSGNPAKQTEEQPKQPAPVELSPKVMQGIDNENELFNRTMEAMKLQHWQNRVVECLRTIEKLEEDNAYLREQVALLSEDEEKEEG